MCYDTFVEMVKNRNGNKLQIIFILFDSNVNDNKVNLHLTVAFSGDIRKLLGSKENNFFP